MINANTLQILGMICGLTVFILIGILSGKRIKTKDDYYVAGETFTAVPLAGSISGLYIGGGFIIGAAQLAFTDGFSGLHFSCGCATAIAATGLFYLGPMRDSGHKTFQELIRAEYGATACLLTTLLGVAAFYVNNMSHVLSGVSLISSIFPFSTFVCATITGLVIVACAFFGGFLGMSLINILKTIILAAGTLLSAALIFVLTSNYSDIAAAVPARYLMVSPRGVNTDLGNILSYIFGIMSTQTSVQAMFSARSNKDGKVGFVLGACILPIVGMCCTIIGLYMYSIAPDMDSLQAFPQFILTHTNSFFGGIILGTTLVALSTAGASVLLGISSVLLNNIYLRAHPEASMRRQIWLSRIVIVALVSTTIYLITSGSSDSIMRYNSLSMGLRGAIIFVPMSCALFIPGTIPKQFACACIIAGPTAILVCQFVLKTTIDCTFVWIAINFAIMITGYIYGKFKKV